MVTVRGSITFTTPNGMIRVKNHIINLHTLMNQITKYPISTPSSVKSAIIVINGTPYSATQGLKINNPGYVSIVFFTSTPQVTIKSMQLYPNSLSTFTLPLACYTNSSGITNNGILTWCICIEDSSGITFSIIPPSVIPSQKLYTGALVYDNYSQNYVSFYMSGNSLYALFIDNSNATGDITIFAGAYVPVYGYTASPSPILINKPGIQLVPANTSQASAFYYLLSAMPLKFRFSFNQYSKTSSGEPQPADGFAVTLFSSTPPRYYNTSTVSGMGNSKVTLGCGVNIVVEFDPYYSPSFSVTVWQNGNYVKTLVPIGTSGNYGMAPCHCYCMCICIYCSNGTVYIKVFVKDITCNKTIASLCKSFPISCFPGGTAFSVPFYAIITARTCGSYANWSIIALDLWYPYFNLFPVLINKTTNPVVPFSYTVTFTHD